jgi:hypothetical protein
MNKENDMSTQTLKHGDFLVVARGPKLNSASLFGGGGDSGYDRSYEGMLYEVVWVSGCVVLARCVASTESRRDDHVGRFEMFSDLEYNLQAVPQEFADVLLQPLTGETVDTIDEPAEL